MAASIFGASKVVDCSHVLDGASFSFMSLFTEPARFEEEKVFTVAADGFAKSRYTMNCDLGAHLDSPAHFVAGGKTISDLSADDLTARAAVIDVSDKVDAQDDGNYGLTIDDVKEYKAKYGQIPERHLSS